MVNYGGFLYRNVHVARVFEVKPPLARYTEHGHFLRFFLTAKGS